MTDTALPPSSINGTSVHSTPTVDAERTTSGAPAPAAGERPTIAVQPRRLAWPRRLALALTATDAVAITVAVMVAQLARFGVGSLGTTPPETNLEYGVLAAILGVSWMTALWATKSRQRRIIGVGLVEYQRVANATFITFGLLAVVAFLFHVEIARGYLAIALPTGLVLLLLDRVIWRRALQSLRQAGRCLTGAIIVGPRHDVERVVEELRRNLRAGYRPIAVAVTDDPRAQFGLGDLPGIAMTELVDVSRKARIRAVMMAGSLPGGNAQIRELSWSLENSKVELILVSRLIEVAGPRIHLRPVEGLPMVHVDLPQYSGFNHSVKRAFDVYVSAAALILLSPFLGLVALAIKLDSRGPVFFRQERVGVQGARFTMLKFRSMVVDAEARLPQLESKSDGNGVLFKMKDDPRVTRVGRVIRRFSLDEFPQLWNVFEGTMSLVGPRPPLPREVELYERTATRRLLIKPGVTGLWQVSGRSNLSWEQSLRLDLYYVENWSITSDLLIILRTVKAMFRPDGAY
jgi:exopolysaccharide biosynthesis polyprenyl glycosylphosphotransferase